MRRMAKLNKSAREESFASQFHALVEQFLWVADEVDLLTPDIAEWVSAADEAVTAGNWVVAKNYIKRVVEVAEGSKWQDFGLNEILAAFENE